MDTGKQLSLMKLNSSLFLLIALTAALFCLGQAGPVEAKVIFEDDFDSYPDWSTSTNYDQKETWPDTIATVLGGPGSTADAPDWYSYRVAPISNHSGRPLYVVDNTDYHGSSGKSLQYNLENNSYMNGGGMDLYLGGGATGGYDEIYIRTFLKLESGFDFQDGGSQFIKLFRLYTGVDPDNDDFSPSSTFATIADYNSTPRVKRSMFVILYIVEDGNNDYRLKFGYALGRLAGVDYIENTKVFPASTFNFKDYLGEWLYVECYAKLNTVGQADGEIKLWITPESNISNISQSNPTVSWTGLEIRSTEDRKFNTLIVADNMSGQWERPVKEQTVAYDDLVISTSYIGPDYVIGGGLTADLNNDGTVDILDLQACANHILGTQDYGKAADVNGDGSVNVQDIQEIVNIILNAG